MELTKELNESQQAAVEYIDGPSLVIAGAGSGKTRVLTYKIAYLLYNNVQPWRIMALTFTNKAAREMKERIGKLVGAELAEKLQMGTFHSVFSRILRIEAETLGFQSNYTIYDETDSRSLIKAIIKEMELDDSKYKPASIQARISMAKNHLVSADSYLNDADERQRDINSRVPETGSIFKRYEQRLRQANAMDFDDLLVHTFRLFRDHEEIREKYVGKYDFVLVDEYQDTNYAQQQIVWLLTKEKQKVCVVGDDSQSIYSFRGANIDNILNFNHYYPEAKLFKLERNYRSTQRIVQAANSLIRHNDRQIHKEVYSENAEGDKLRYLPTHSDKEESMLVCREIMSIKRKETCGYGDFAILYRTNSQSRSFEEEMRKRGIPYRVYGGLSFYQRKEIKDIIAYFRMVANPNDEEALKRIINYPARGIGNTTVAKIMEAARINEVSLWTVISNPAQYGLNVNNGTLAKLDTFRKLILGFMERMVISDVYTLGSDIIKESGIANDLYSQKDVESLARQENVEELLAGMQAFVEERVEEGRGNEVHVADYLQDVALLTDLDSDDGNADERVTLMTIHSAKGLEFPTVFVVGLEENIFPSPRATATLRDLEEERRLLYVAITRAERHCILTNAKTRWHYGKMEFDAPSRFINEIDPRLLDCQDDSEKVSPDVITSQYRERVKHVLFPDETKSSTTNRVLKPLRQAIVSPVSKTSASTSVDTDKVLQVGDLILHERFGKGEVKKVEGVGENAKATIDFVNCGTKQLLLKFARFKKI